MVSGQKAKLFSRFSTTALRPLSLHGLEDYAVRVTKKGVLINSTQQLNLIRAWDCHKKTLCLFKPDFIPQERFNMGVK